MPRSAIRALAAILLASGCATPGPTAGGVDVVDERYAVDGLRFTATAGVAFMTRAFDEGGETRLCGAYAGFGDGLPASLVEDAVRFVRLSLGGETLAEDLSFFNQLPANTAPIGGAAACRDTGVPWRAEFEGERPTYSVFSGRPAWRRG